MNIARVLGAVAVFAAVAIGIASPGVGRRSDYTYVAHCSCPGRSRWGVERHLYLHCGLRKHNYVDDHTVWPRMRQCRSDRFVSG